jgi:hypothetical protein
MAGIINTLLYPSPQLAPADVPEALRLWTIAGIHVLHGYFSYKLAELKQLRVAARLEVTDDYISILEHVVTRVGVARGLCAISNARKHSSDKLLAGECRGAPLSKA